MDRRKLVALGRRDDPHINAVLDCLADDVQGSVFDFTESDERFALSYTDGEFSIDFGSVNVCSLDPVIVWPRIKSPQPIHYASQAVDETTYAIGQWIGSIFAALALLDEAHIFNSGAYQGARRAKPFQIFTAIQAGLSVPETSVTNSVEALKGIGSQSLVYKPVNELVHRSAGRPLTTGFHLNELIEAADTVGRHPAIFQERICGVWEWRVHVFGGDHFAFRQPSVHGSEDRVDVRLAGSSKLKPGESPKFDEVLPKCRKFLSMMKWDIGIFDFIETADGDFIFIECNYDGQWYWAVDRYNLPMAASLAEVFRTRLDPADRECRL